MDNLQAVPDWFWIFSAGCFGAIAGSYVNMAAYRLPRNISTVTRTRSFCPRCNAQLKWYENLPILSFLFLRGKCGHCKAAIPIRYLFTELLVTALFCLAAYQFFTLNSALYLPHGFEWWRLVAVFAVQLFLSVDLVLLAVVDLETWLIPWETTLPWIGAGLLLSFIFPELHAHATTWVDGSIFGIPAKYFNAPIDSFTGMVIGAGTLWGVGFLTTVFTFLWYRWKKLPERPKEGMGLGDVHLMAMIGALLGWKPVVAALFLAIFIGSFSGVAKILWDKFQQRRQGGNYKPWQPAFEVPADEAPYVPRFWPLALCGIVVFCAALAMFQQSGQSFQFMNYQMAPTLEETISGARPLTRQAIDLRLFPAVMMMGIAILLLFSFPFFLWLEKLDLLPQGSIRETDSGEKEEVLQGNYIPFGPSLALAALLVAFYDPLLRNVAWWFFNGGNGPVPPPAYEVIAGAQATVVLVWIAGIFKGL